MLNNITSFINGILTTSQVRTVAPVNSPTSNPFANPFVSGNNNSATYGKNKPFTGGYFAGYYNGKPNIVGTRLFVEV